MGFSTNEVLICIEMQTYEKGDNSRMFVHKKMATKMVAISSISFD